MDNRKYKTILLQYGIRKFQNVVCIKRQPDPSQNGRVVLKTCNCVNTSKILKIMKFRGILLKLLTHKH